MAIRSHHMNTVQAWKLQRKPWMSAWQWAICELKAQGHTYAQIREYCKQKGQNITNDEALCRCFRKTAKGLYWAPKETKGGGEPYLCREDEQELIMAIQNGANELYACPTDYVLNFAHQLRINRLESAVEFLHGLGCDRLADTINVDVPPPTRQWLCEFCKQKHLSIRCAQRLEGIRRKACDRVRVTRWFQRNAGILQMYDPELILNMDETGLSTNRRFKVVVPEGAAPVVPGTKMQDFHITAMITVSAKGKIFRTGIILANFSNLPEELNEHVQNFDFYSTKSGWVTKEVFELWAMNLAHEVNSWKQQLPSHLRNRRVLLLVDGHGSRKSSKAISYLQQFGIDVLIFPGHSTHVLQPFDVGLASLLKTKMAEHINRWNRLLEGGARIANSVLASKRRVLVTSFRDAMDEALTTRAIVNSFAIAGIVPLNPERPLSSHLMLDDSGFQHWDDWISGAYFAPLTFDTYTLRVRDPCPRFGFLTIEDMTRTLHDRMLTPIRPLVIPARIIES